MTVKEWVAFWQKNYDVPGVRHTTYEAHRYVLENHILPWIGDCPLESLTTQKIERFLEEHQLDGNKRNGKPLSQQTMRHIQNLLSKVLRQAATHGLIERNPVQGICCSAPKKVKATILADNEVRDYLSAAEELGYMSHLEHAPVLQAIGLSEPYQSLAEFNGTVLAGRQTEKGAKFVTWDWDFNHTGLNHGHYYEGNYAGAKRDFAIRAGLIPDERQFTAEQLIEIYQQSAYIRFSCSLPEEQERIIDGIQQRIQELVPDCEERIAHSMETNAVPCFEQTI